MKRVLISFETISCLFFLTACGTNNSLFPASGSNRSSSCKAWEVAFSASFKTGISSSGQSYSTNTPIPIEKGWEPFAFADYGGVAIRRCVMSP
jgi:hypothetical protein